MTKIITRFAPSPTGFLHVGGVRTALFAWAFAKKENGTFILRIEDTDKDREVEGSVEHIMESLRWLGINWDEGPEVGGANGPYLQSERLDTYKKYAQILIDRGFAYADPYSSEEVQSFRDKSIQEGRPFLFRDYRPDNPPEWKEGMPLRFKVPTIKSYKWHDLTRGNLEAGEEALDDFVILKSDGYPTYNFAHIIDDYLMKVTHIFRADEFISSVPKFLSLYEALEIEHPQFVTLPPIMSPDGRRKLGKRDGAKDILEYREEGYLSDAMVNFLAFIGWNPGDEREIFSPDEFIREFTIEKIHTGGAKFNEQKLDWVNKEHIKRLPINEKEKNIKEYLEKYKKADWNTSSLNPKFIELITERISKWGDIEKLVREGEINYFFENPYIEPKLLPWKDDSKEIAAKHLNNAKDIIVNLKEEDLNDKIIKKYLMEYADKEGRGSVLWPIRYALTGLEKSPDPFILIEILGKEVTLKRWENAINILQQF